MPFTGLTDDGLEVPTGNEWLELIRDSINDRLDEELPFSENDILGTITVEMALRLAGLSEALKALDDQTSVQTASGAYLEDYAELIGVNRDDGLPSTVAHQSFTGDFLTVIEPGTRVEGGGENDSLVWETTEGTELGIVVAAIDAISSGSYNITVQVASIGSETFNLSVPTNGEQAALLRQFQKKIQSSKFSEALSVELVDLDLNGDPVRAVVRSDKGLDTDITANASQIAITKGYAFVPIRAVEDGPYTADKNQIDKIIDQVDGLDVTTNLRQPSPGRFTADDKQLREARGERLQRNSTASGNSIRAKVSELPFVEAAVVPENEKDVARTVDGMSLPRSSIAVVVWPASFTDEQRDEIASIVYQNATHGMEVAEDSNLSGFARTVETKGQTTKRIFIHYAQTNSIDVDIDCSIKGPFAENDIRQQIVNSLKDYLGDLSVSDNVRRLTIYGLIDEIPAVESVSKLELNQSPSDIIIDATEIATTGNINVDFV